MNKEQIYSEALEVYAAISEVTALQGCGYCLSWWINTRNFPLKTTMSTPKINRRARLLVKLGYLIIDRKETSTSSGTCYKLTELKP
jgi:hypothetical protein